MYLQKGVIIIGGHVQALSLTRSYGENNIPVYILDRLNCLAKYSKYCQKFFICPDFSSNAFTDFLIELAKIENIKDWVLIPTNDHAVINLSKNKSELDEYYKMLVPPFEIIDHIYDKVKLIEIAKQLNIPTPNTQCFSNNTIDLNYLEFPIITKGKYGLTFYHTLKKKAFISSSPIELKKNLEQIQTKYKLEDIFSQTVISSKNNNKTISFTSYSENGEIKAFWMGAKLRQHPISFGTATFAKSVYEADILDYASRLIKHFEYTGVCEIEFLKDPIDLKFKLIEINARTWLWVGLAKECGINYALYIYNYLNNLPNNFPQNYQLGVKWINRITDTLFSIKAILTGNLKIKEYFYTTDGKTIDALYKKGDKKPYFAYIMLLISFARKR